MKRILAILLFLSVAQVEADQRDNAATTATTGANNAGMQALLLGKMAAESKDSSTKSMLMMMMMQQQMQQAASQQAAKKNKEKDEKKDKKEDEQPKMPTPAPLAKNPIEATKPEENLNMVETTLKKDDEKRAAAEGEPTPSDIPTFKLPEIKVAQPEPSATAPVPERSLSLSGSKTTLSAIPRTEEKFQDPNRGLASTNPNPNGGMPPILRNQQLGNEEGKAQPAATASAAETASAENSKVRKTDESAAAASESGGGSEKEASSSDNFFASLMEQMNGGDSAEEQNYYHEEEPQNAAENDSGPVNIFEYASSRYQEAHHEGRIRHPSHSTKAAMR